MNPPASIFSAIRELTGQQIASCEPVSGGDIAAAFRLQAGNDERWFLKILSNPPAGFFSAEADGLKRIAQTTCIATPEVIAFTDTFLLMEYLEPATPSSEYWITLARQLAAMHCVEQSGFGLEIDNYCGLTPQINHTDKKPKNSGHAFFRDYRLLFQANRALASGLLTNADFTLIEQLANRLEALIPNQPPALIHGDLWSGNHLCTAGQHPVLIDPACYCGWAEADIAMTLLFGGFPPAFYRAYNESNPLLPGWQARAPLYNLYHLLNHLNLFGSSYYRQIMTIVKRFT